MMFLTPVIVTWRTRFVNTKKKVMIKIMDLRIGKLGQVHYKIGTLQNWYTTKLVHYKIDTLQNWYTTKLSF